MIKIFLLSLFLSLSFYTYGDSGDSTGAEKNQCSKSFSNSKKILEIMQIREISVEKLQFLTSHQSRRINPEDLEFFTEQQIQALEITHLSKEQLKHINMEYLSVRQIEQLDLNLLSSEKVWELYEYVNSKLENELDQLNLDRSSIAQMDWLKLAKDEIKRVFYKRQITIEELNIVNLEIEYIKLKQEIANNEQQLVKYRQKQAQYKQRDTSSYTEMDLLAIEQSILKLSAAITAQINLIKANKVVLQITVDRMTTGKNVIQHSNSVISVLNELIYAINLKMNLGVTTEGQSIYKRISELVKIVNENAEKPSLMDEDASELRTVDEARSLSKGLIKVEGHIATRWSEQFKSIVVNMESAIWAEISNESKEIIADNTRTAEIVNLKDWKERQTDP